MATGKRVWVEDWQMQCCGPPFAVGASVRWGLVPVDDEERRFLATLLGEDAASEITDREEHHAGEGDAQDVDGVVLSIEAAFCEMAHKTINGQPWLVPVEGSTLRRERTTADGWEPDEDEHTFRGYIVDLDISGVDDDAP